MIESSLLSNIKSRYKAKNYRVNHLISVTHSTFSAFDPNILLDVRCLLKLIKGI